MAGIKLMHVPYRGSSPALTDLLGGHVDIYFSSLPPAVGITAEGKVRALAVTGLARSHVFPDLPTVDEAGLPGYEAVLHYGIAAPAGTPRPIIDKLNAALRKALDAPEIKAQLVNTGGGGSAQHAGGVRRRHRPGGDQVVPHRQGGRREGELTPQPVGGWTWTAGLSRMASPAGWEAIPEASRQSGPPGCLPPTMAALALRAKISRS